MPSRVKETEVEVQDDPEPSEAPSDEPPKKAPKKAKAAPKKEPTAKAAPKKEPKKVSMKVPEQESPEPEEEEEETAPPVEEPIQEEVKPRKAKTNLKDRHTCGACGQEMSLHTALYGHKNCPGKPTMPQPPALVRHPPPEPQLTQAQSLRMQLAQAAQERRAQAQLRMVTPIRQFYGL